VSAPAVEAMLEAELWVSLVSLLRSYAAVANLDSGDTLQFEETENSITASAGHAHFDMQCDLRTGAGNWQLRNRHEGKAQGRFQLLGDGRIALDDKTLDLDHAAIDFAAALKAAAARTARNEP